MEYNKLTNEKLIAIKNKIEKILKDRENGKKRRISNSELTDIFKKNHDKFVSIHTLSGGKVFPDSFPDTYPVDEGEMGFGGYLIFVGEGNDEYSTVYYRIEVQFMHDGRGAGDYTKVDATSIFGDSAHYDEGWEDVRDTEERKSRWIVVDDDVPSFEYIRKLAKNLGLI